MAKIPINDPKHWRERAQEARTIADTLTDPDAKRKMLRIAADYEAYCVEGVADDTGRARDCFQ